MFEKLPLFFFVGVGCAQLVVSGLVAIYYNMIIAYALFYFFASLAKTLPWKHCDHDWNTNGVYFTRTDVVSACLNFQTNPNQKNVVPCLSNKTKYG